MGNQLSENEQTKLDRFNRTLKILLRKLYSGIQTTLQTIPQVVRKSLRRPHTKLHVLLVPGLSHIDTPTFNQLVEELEQHDDIDVVSFSYKGFYDRNFFEPNPYVVTDITEEPMEAHVQQFEKYVETIFVSSTAPLVVIGHSFAGLVVANWICKPRFTTQHQANLTRIASIIFLASPIHPPREEFELPSGDSYIVTPEGYNRDELFRRFPGCVVNLLATSDDLANTSFASLENLPDSLIHPFIQRVLPQTDHFSITKNRYAKKIITIILRSRIAS